VWTTLKSRVKHNGDPLDLLAARDAMVASFERPFVLNIKFPYLAFSPGSGIDFYMTTVSEKQIRHPHAMRKPSGWQYALSHKEEIVDLILRRTPRPKIARPFSSKQTRRKCLSNRA
jgi:hypothetical protein